MKIGTFITPNEKGQIVIPKSMRNSLGITTDTTLYIVQVGQSIEISPVEDFLLKTKTESSLPKLLELTQGTWGQKEISVDAKQKSLVELKASSQRKKKW